MRCRQIFVSGVAFGGALMLSAPTAVAQTTAVGPYYATPAWDQTIPCTAPASCPRFVVLSNMSGSAVLDRETGLVWERDVPTFRIILTTAETSCIAKSIGGRQGWRLPTHSELRTLIDTSRANPRSPDGHPFFNVVLDSDISPWYWTTTPTLDGSGIRAVSFVDSGFVISLNTAAGAAARHWCVRGPGTGR